MLRIPKHSLRNDSYLNGDAYPYRCFCNLLGAAFSFVFWSGKGLAAYLGLQVWTTISCDIGVQDIESLEGSVACSILKSGLAVNFHGVLAGIGGRGKAFQRGLSWGLARPKG